MKCYLCKKEIELNKVIAIVKYGEFIKDNMIGAISFEEPQCQNVLGYAHINCMDKNDRTNNKTRIL